MRAVSKSSLRSIAVVLFCCLAAGDSMAQRATQTALQGNSTWAWLFIGPMFDRWEIETGKTIVMVDGTKLTAELTASDAPNVVLFMVSGTISGDQVKARVTRPHSD